MEIDVSHSESWAIAITREDAVDDWPDCKQDWAPHAPFRPDVIFVRMHRGSNKPDITISGCKLKKDGSPGVARGICRPYGDGERRVPDWVQEITERVRTLKGLGPGRTEVGW